MNIMTTFPSFITLTPVLARGRWGTLQPRIDVRAAPGTHYRERDAVLHAVAAHLAVATPTSEGWAIVIEKLDDERGSVSLELVDGTEAEAARGMALLHELAR